MFNNFILKNHSSILKKYIFVILLIIKQMASKNVKYCSFLLIILIFTSCGLPYKSGMLVLNDGTKKEGVIKPKDENLLFKKSSHHDDQESFHYTEIDYVKKPNFDDEPAKFKYLKVVGGNFKLIEEVIIGPVSLYKNTSTYYVNHLGATAGMPGAHMGGFGVPMPQTSTGYYIRRKNDRHVMYMSSNYIFTNTLKKKGPWFFRDCPELVKKIENKDFKKDQVEEVVHFYNDHCAMTE